MGDYDNHGNLTEEGRKRQEDERQEKLRYARQEAYYESNTGSRANGCTNIVAIIFLLVMFALYMLQQAH
jgi:hypothetical protein